MRRHEADPLQVLKNDIEILDQLIVRAPVGVVWLSGRQTIIRATPEAFKIADDTQAYELGDQLRWHRTEDSIRFERCWSDQTRASSRFVAGTPAGDTLTVCVRRTSLSPLPGVMERAGVVTLSRNHRPEAPPVTILQELFGLTPAESRLANALFDTLVMRDAAHKCEITIGTARIYLKRIFAKTGTKSQSELISALSLIAIAHFLNRSRTPSCTRASSAETR